jgi:hypothetical protein
MNGVEFATRAPGVRWQTTDIAPPSPYYFGPDDELLITAQQTPGGAVAGAELLIRARFLHTDGRAVPNAWRMTVVPDTTLQSVLLPMSEGFLLSLIVEPGIPKLFPGQCFVNAHVRQAGLNLGTLLAGYVETGRPLFWPGGQLAGQREGVGNNFTFIGTDPAAGVEISELVPAFRFWRIASGWFQLTTSATVVARSVHVIIDDPFAQIVYEVQATLAQAASTTATYSLGEGLPRSGATELLQLMPMPQNFWLGSGRRIRTATVNLQAGDDFGPLQLMVDEWIQG